MLLEYEIFSTHLPSRALLVYFARTVYKGVLEMKSLFTISLFMFSSLVSAQTLFVIKKNFNPKNVLHFDAVVKNCKLQAPVVNPYWIMGERGGRTEGLNAQERRYFTPRVTYNNGREAEFTLPALNEMAGRLDSSKITIRLVDCKPKSYISYQGNEVEASELYAHGRLTLVPFGWNTKYMIIKGKNAAGGPVSIRLEP
jgi:hypothetical protein